MCDEILKLINKSHKNDWYFMVSKISMYGMNAHCTITGDYINNVANLKSYKLDVDLVSWTLAVASVHQ